MVIFSVLGILVGTILYPSLNDTVVLTENNIFNGENVIDSESQSCDENLTEVIIHIGDQITKRYIPKENALELKEGLENDNRNTILCYIRGIDLTEKNMGLIERLYTKKNYTLKNYNQINKPSKSNYTNALCIINGTMYGQLISRFDKEFFLKWAENWFEWEKWGRYSNPFFEIIGKKMKNLFWIPFYVRTHRPIRFPILLTSAWGYFFEGKIESVGLQGKWCVQSDINSWNIINLDGFTGIWFQVNFNKMSPDPGIDFIGDWYHWFKGFAIKCRVESSSVI